MSSARRMNLAAVVSITSGLLTIASVQLRYSVVLTMLLSMTAIVSGHIARSAIRRDAEKFGGTAIASIGLAIGYLGVVSGLVAVALLNVGFLSFGGR